MMLSINSQNPQTRLIKKVSDILLDGGIVIYPTDTVYGLGCNLFNKRGIEKIYEIKKRSKKQPLSFICADLKDISKYAQVTDFAYKTMKRYLPGPYTFILQASRVVPKIILPKRQTTGIRIPDNRICMALVAELGQPIISTSVKTDNDQYMNDPEEIEKAFKHRVDVIINGGVLASEPSSIISLIDDDVEVLRVGKGDVSEFM
ncbi:MAG: Threonylcarbamoyl-AMP synthase [Syntrophus sp. PtaB.Bin001]|nr:MAG: Threonylcarbamoyl-AMP synthase [Syntrophus sp. PtaB.Bin001]